MFRSANLAKIQRIDRQCQDSMTTERVLGEFSEVE
jgi:hypothetical protein